MLYLAEYTDIGSTGRGSVPIPMEPAVATQVLDVTAGVVVSAAFQPTTCIVSLVADEDCMIAVGKDPSGAQSKLRAGVEKLISVPAGAGLKVAVTAANITKTGNMDSLESLIKLLASPADAQKQYAIMQTNIDKMGAAAANLRKDSEENQTIRDQLVQSTSEALAAKAAADKAAADVAAREAALDRDTSDYADKAKADRFDADQRAKVLNEREADLTANLASLNKRGSDLADRAASLDAKEKDLKAREDAAAAIQSDYEARIARFKALTG